VSRRVRLAELTSAEARARLSRRPVILLPMGSLEEQGPHAPMGDFLLAERIAVAMAERAEAAGAEALVAPVIPFGGADWFGPIPGGIALRPATLAALLGDMLAALRAHGLDRVLIINGHGGNAGPIEEATRAVRQAGGPLIPTLHIWRALGARWSEFATAPGTVGHGGDPVWSVALALVPELCRPDQLAGPAPSPPVLGLPVTGFGSIRFEGVELTVPIGIDSIAPSGVFGADPRGGSAEAGAAAVAWLAEVGARLIAHLHGFEAGERR
jgi:creatinine amidohydrolase